MNIFQLQCFLTVANTLSFAKAAEQLNVSQPTITHQIKSLEHELNVKLFRRSTRFVEITPEGQSFVGDARSMVMISARAKLRFSTPEEHPISRLVIGCSSYTEFHILTEILNTMNQSIPNFHPRSTVAPLERLQHLLETEQIDILFHLEEMDNNKTHINYKKLIQSAIVAVCRFDHPLASKESLEIKQLMDESLIFCDPISIATDITKLQFRLAEIHHPNKIHFSSNVDAAIALASGGIGIAFLPEIYITENTLLRKIPLKNAPELSFGMYYKSFPGDSLLKKFIQETKKYFNA